MTARRRRRRNRRILTPFVLVLSLILLGLTTYGVVSAALSVPAPSPVGVITHMHMIEPDIWI